MARDAEVLRQTKMMTLDRNVNSPTKINLAFVLTSPLFQIYLLILIPFLFLFSFVVLFLFCFAGYSFMQSMVSSVLVNKFHVYFGYQFYALHSLRTHLSNERNRF